MSWDHPNNNIIENGKNTENSPGDLRRLAVTQTPVKDHQLTLIWKTRMEVIIIIIIISVIINIISYEFPEDFNVPFLKQWL